MTPGRAASDITVVMPAYQAASFIAGTLDTVFAQTILPDAVIVVDDGSTDGTRAIVQEIAAAHPECPTRLLTESHRGPGAARNAGIRAATTTWIAFLDSDDLWRPQKIETVIAAMRANPDASFFCHNEIIRSLDGVERPTDYAAGYRPGEPLPPQLYRRNFFSTSAVVCRRSLLLEVGGFDEFLSSAQDYEMWLRLSPHIVPAFIPGALGVYVLRPGNITTSRFWRRLRNIVRVTLRHRDKAGSMRVVTQVATVVVLHLLGPVRELVGRLLPRRRPQP